MSQDRFDTRLLAPSSGFGVCQAIIVLWLGALVRGQSLMSMYAPDTIVAGVVLAGTVVGLIVLGTIPVYLLLSQRLVLPLVGYLVLLSLSFIQSYAYFAGARATNTTPIGLYYDSLFGLLWFVPLGIVIGLAVIEFVIRRQRPFQANPLA